MTICGEGTYNYTARKKTYDGSDKGMYMSTPVAIPSGSTLVMDVRQTSTYYADQDYYANFYVRYYAGTVVMTEKNETRGFIQLLANEGKNLSVSSIGLGKEKPSCLGYSDVQAASGGTIYYTGAGETCDRALYITNSSPFQYNKAAASRTPSAGILHYGSGYLIWKGPIRATGVPASGNPSITFNPYASASRTIVFAGELDEKLAIYKTGSGVLRIETNLVNTGVTSIKEGTLAVAPAASLSPLSPLTVTATSKILFEGDGTERIVALSNMTQTAGTTTLEVQNGTTLVVSNFTYTAGSVKVVRTGASEVRILDAALAGTSPSWLTFNGAAATIGADGVIVPAAYPNMIAARGDKVPNKPGERVTIFKLGTTGPDTLAANAVTVGTLLQAAPIPATLALAANQVLTADVVSVAADSKTLAIGDTDGQGTLSPSNGVLALTGASATEGIAIAAKAQAKQIVSTTIGATNVLSGGVVGDEAEGARLRVTRGALTLTGEEPIRLRDFHVGTNISQTATGILRIVDAHDVQLSTNGVFAVGSTYVGDPFITGESTWATLDRRGDLVISNATIVSERPTSELFNRHTCEAGLCVGHTGYGVCTIEPDTVITSRLFVGCGTFANMRSSCGILHQHGGALTVWSCASKSYPGCAIGLRSGYGYYHMTSGSLTVLNGDLSVGQLGLGTFAVEDGTIEVNGTLRFANENGGKGYMRLSGGSLTTKTISIVDAASGGTGILLIENGAVVKDSNSLGITGGSGSSRSDVLDDAYLNVNSGATIEAAGFQSGAAIRGNYSGVRQFSIGFNGGTFKANKNKVDNIFYSNTYLTASPVTNVFVYAGGLTIDTGTNTVGVGSTLKGPTGLGLAAIPLATPIASRSEPLVRIVGDGFGATAVAIFDVENQQVTGFRVTSSGSGYTTATAKVYLSSTSDSAAKSYPCELASATSGGLTKKGSGTLNLNCANTYTGATRVVEGTLVLNATNALPAVSTLVFAGGTVTAQRPEYFPSSVTIDQTIEETTDRLNLATFPNGTPDALPNLVGLEPSDWRLSFSGTSLRLIRRNGMILILK